MDRHLSPNAALAALRIDGARLWQSLMDLAQIGAAPWRRVPHRPHRPGSPGPRPVRAMGAGRRLQHPRADAIGNIFARPRGQDDNLPPVMTAAISTRSPRAASSTATTACWPA